MSQLVKKSYEILFNKECPYKTSLKHSRAFKGYNANVRFNEKELKFRVSHKWKGVSSEIKSGLIQSLLNKVFKTKKSSINIDMYNIFLKKVHLTIPKKNKDELLINSFNRVNDKYFNGMILIPNLRWGSPSLSKVGSYDYGTDTIRLSSLLKKDENLLDYVMYHELLHKKLKFTKKNSRNYHHTKEFKRRENEFEDKDAEKKLKRFLKKQRAKKILKIW
ncbi:hypothetical protein GF327_00455 [Candidatus Woesearchaeota archaeon]|nr:hypothetical protein [Candidatus Woesearchaeota archaeon]